jgi:hypothetical protein
MRGRGERFHQANFDAWLVAGDGDCDYGTGADIHTRTDAYAPEYFSMAECNRTMHALHKLLTQRQIAGNQLRFHSDDYCCS